jgi:xanthine dehydrogenase large subunit
MIAYAVPKEDGTMLVYSSTQHPGEIQHQVAHALDVDANGVVVDCRRMGGDSAARKASRPFRLRCCAIRTEAAASRETSGRPRRRHDDHRQAP